MYYDRKTVYYGLEFAEFMYIMGLSLLNSVYYGL